MKPMTEIAPAAGSPASPDAAVRGTLQALLGGARPNLYGLRRHKAALVARLGPEAAAATLAEAAGWGGGWRAVPARLARLRDHAHRAATEFAELSPAQDILAPALAGMDGELRTAMNVRTRSFWFGELSDATVISKSNLVLHGGQPLYDVEPGEWAEIPLQLDVDPAIIAHAGDAVWLMQPPAARGPLRERRALSLLGVHSYAFGHWVCEFLPKLWACLQRPDAAGVTLLVDAQMPPQHLEAVRLCVGDAWPVRVVPPGGRVQVDRLWYCSMPSYFPVGPRPDVEYRDGLLCVDPVVSGRLLEQALARMLPAVPPPAAGQPRRLYLARRDDQHRRLTNRAHVEALFAARGFVIVDFRTLPFREQLQLMRAADVVAGPDGSAFMTTFFGRRGLRILTLNNPCLDDFQMYSLVCATRGQTWFVLPGEVAGRRAEYPGMTGYVTDLTALARMLERLLGPDPHPPPG
jgi:hypothetical protein